MENQIEMSEESEELFENFIMNHGNSRVIAVNGRIVELINEILRIEHLKIIP
jgi:hypothetical protein